MAKNIWQDNKIPEREYCSVKRAAELLRCSSDDVFYWAGENYIQLCVKLYDIHCKLLVALGNSNIDIDREMLLTFYMELALSDNPSEYLKKQNGLFFAPDIVEIYPNFSFSTNDQNKLIHEIFESLREKFHPVAIDGIWALDNKIFDNYNKKKSLGEEPDNDFDLMVRFLNVVNDDAVDDILSHTIDGINRNKDIFLSTSFLNKFSK
ncbi:hypothetical protein [Xenorhabdus bovienii]|uniref:hypothetical protein n=1 Tax=Xenorhabdus bovienii TaxID=40576 RepID=UPI0023B26E3E|nr:hypothetical protein [Xenorhabdus bovienii]